MSQRSERLAAYVRQSLGDPKLANEANVNRNRLLNEGFLRLREDIRKAFETQIDELQHEPGCASALLPNFSGDKWEVIRLDDHDLRLAIRFDSADRTASIKCDKPTKFGYYAQVKLNTAETGWYYAAGEKKNDLSPCNDRVDWLVEKALYALFGVET